MVEAIPMGNDTAELLDREASQWKQSTLSSEGKTLEDDLVAYDGAERPALQPKSSAVPTNGPNGHQRHHERGSDADSYVRKEEHSPYPINSAPQSQRQGEKTPNGRQLNKSAERVSPKVPVKKRKIDSPTRPLEYFASVFGEAIPSLHLDSDLDSEFTDTSHEPQPPHAINRGTVDSSAISLATKGLNLRLRPLVQEQRARTAPHGPQKRIGDLEAALETKEEEIARLKIELNEMKSEHKAEVSSVIKTLHKEYSKQASTRLRELYKQAETKARKHAEEVWKSENEELKALVQSERAEKSELVRACDEYLKLNGF